MLSLKHQEHVCCFSLGVYGLFGAFALLLFWHKEQDFWGGDIKSSPRGRGKALPFPAFLRLQGLGTCSALLLEVGESPDPYTVTSSQNSGSLAHVIY